MGWVKLCPGRSCIGISRHFSEKRLFKKVHLFKTVAFYRCSVAIQALKIKSIQLSFPPPPFAYRRQSNLVLPISYVSTLGWDLGTCIFCILYCCNMESLQGWNYLCNFTIGSGPNSCTQYTLWTCFFPSLSPLSFLFLHLSGFLPV